VSFHAVLYTFFIFNALGCPGIQVVKRLLSLLLLLFIRLFCLRNSGKNCKHNIRLVASAWPNVTLGALKTQVLEKASMKQRISQGWKTHVRICRDGKRKYGKFKYNANLQSDKKSLVFHKLVWCIFKWGGQVDYRLFLSEIT